MPDGFTPERYGGWDQLDKVFCGCHRVPRVTADLFGARPVDLAILEGIETCKGGEGPWIPGVKPIQPGINLIGRNAVTTDAIGVAAMGFDPTAGRGEDVWVGDNHLDLLAQAGVGTNDPSNIEVRGVPLKDAVCEYHPGHVGVGEKAPELAATPPCSAPEMHRAHRSTRHRPGRRDRCGQLL